MMEKPAKRLLLLILLSCLLLFTGCSQYFSSYRALMLVRSNTPHSAFMRFASLDGRMVFTLKTKAGGKLKASAKLASGSAAVYLDDGTKREWFSLRGGEEADLESGPLDGDTVALIVETGETCRDGEFHFDME